MTGPTFRSAIAAITAIQLFALPASAAVVDHRLRIFPQGRPWRANPGLWAVAPVGQGNSCIHIPTG